MKINKVAVLGAGLSGITTIKQLQDEGHEVVCFEKQADFGGVFNKLSACYDNLSLTVSNYFMAFSDFVPTEERLKIWTKGEYREYLERYINKFRLQESIQFDHSVESVRQEGDTWIVSVSSNGQVKEQRFDSVAVCTGMFVHKKIPKIQGLDGFKGDILHSQDYKNNKVFTGKNVLCVGLGESSADVTSEISDVAKNCHLSLRRYPAVAPRYIPFQKDTFFTIDTSWNTVRNFNNIPKFFHRQLTGKVFKDYLRSRNPDTVLRGEWVLKSGPAGDQQITKNERVFTHIVDKKVTPNISGINKFTDNSVVFNDGSECELDAVVFCTGYEIKFPFLDVAVDNLRDLYLQMFNPEIGSSLAFIGFARPQQGGVPVIAEMQARYFALLNSGKKHLVDRDAQKKSIEKMHMHWEKEYPITPKATGLVNYCHYMDVLANIIGCVPKKSGFLKDPLLDIKLDYGPLFAAQYRLNGPHSDSVAAKNFLKSFPNTFSWRRISYLWLVQNICSLFSKTARVDFVKQAGQH